MERYTFRSEAEATKTNPGQSVPGFAARIVRMNTNLTRRQTPEERELIKKLAELTTLETALAQRELDLATLHAELRAFERRYIHIVGVRYAELDEIEARIAEALAQFNPRDSQAQQRASQARSRAEESSQTAGLVEKQKGSTEFRPSDRLKKLYREIAKRIHPDLANDEEDRVRRHKLMAEANRAYEDGDEARLIAILREWDMSPESITGDGLGADLVRVIRKIALVEERLRAIETEAAKLKQSDLYQLSTEVQKAAREDRDLLAAMAEQLDRQMTAARTRLAATREGKQQ